MRAFLLPLILAVLAVPVSAAAPRTADPILGLWSNPKGSLVVRTMPCGDRLCGVVKSASAHAVAQARQNGVDPLVGTNLLQGYRRKADGEWTGRILVPAEGRTFSSRIVQTSPDTLQISGCVGIGLFCKTQLWRRTG